MTVIHKAEKGLDSIFLTIAGRSRSKSIRDGTPNFQNGIERCAGWPRVHLTRELSDLTGSFDGPEAGFFCPVAASRFSSDAPHRISKRS